MYFIVVKFKTLPEFTEQFIELATPFTLATRQEPGNLWFDWSRSIDDPSEFVLVEAFLDDDAASSHVNSEHFKAGLASMKPALEKTPSIISRKIEGSSWDAMGELTIG